MGRLRIAAALFCLFVTIVVRTASAAPFKPPPVTEYVTDPSGKLTPAQHATLNKKLALYRKWCVNHVVVFIAPSLDGNTIEEAAFATFKAWKIGDASKDNGVLLLLAPNERQDRIEVGKGLEGQLPDLKANDILRNHVSPHLKKDEFAFAIDDGTTEIATALGACGMEREWSDSYIDVPRPPPPPPPSPTVAPEATATAPHQGSAEVIPPTLDWHEGARALLALILSVLVAIGAWKLGSIARVLLPLLSGPLFYALAYAACQVPANVDDQGIDMGAVYFLFGICAVIVVIIDVVVWAAAGRGGGFELFSSHGYARRGTTASTGSSDWATGSSSSSTFDFSSSSSPTLSSSSSYDASSSSSSSSVDTSYTGGGGTSGGGGSSDSY